MRALISLTCLFVLFSTFAKEDLCKYEKLCKEMDRVVEKFTKSKPPRDLSPVLKMASKLSKKNCKISGVRVNVPVWRACYDQGFESKNGKVVKRFRGPFSEDRVLNWFITIKKENTKEGKKFLNSKEFIQTLDGGYFCLFVDSEAC